VSLNMAKEVAALHKLTVKELQARYAQAFGEPTHSHHKTWLVKRIAWRLQALAEGDLSERALQRARARAAELANDADLRLFPPQTAAAKPVHLLTASESGNEHAPSPAVAPTPVCMKRATRRGPGRLPLPGCKITRVYKGQTLSVKVLPQGFEWAGRVFGSLSAVAKAITGQHCNGYFFFRLGKEQAHADQK
jgi:Protein of unknown function (DUF2924)